MEDVQDYKKKLFIAEKEIKSLKISNKENNHSQAGTLDEISSLKGAKLALETKLRKYATHCQRLEGEKAAIRDAIKSSTSLDESMINAKDDLASFVCALCEKVATLEDENDALASSEEKASGYLMELDRMRDKISKMEKGMSKLQDQQGKLVQSEAELLSKLSSAEGEIAVLRKERTEFQNIAETARGSAADLESEKSRQVQYLEQENLQLMIELKSAKKEANDAKVELSALQAGMQDDMTDDLGRISSPANGLLANKENIPNSVRTPNESSFLEVSPRNNPFSSTKKRTKKESKMTTPTHVLGESKIKCDDENTQECKQS
mmetsp:Transcript_51723/g.77358  ORF Transcript_51723/g.77358 Transcript_51723/m.77358 type:complete len:321 (+) Transcript_51723:72-1034(+)